jgi:flagellar biosynthesis/type III secretory pathway M-ring protein FliF/YscJ
MYTPNTTYHSSIKLIREAASIKLAKYETKRRSLGMTKEMRQTRVKRSLQQEIKRQRTTTSPTQQKALS